MEPCQNATSVLPSSFPAGSCPKGPLPPTRPIRSLAYVLLRRASKSISFFPLKDSYGTTQLAVHRDHADAEKLAALSTVPPESVVLIQGRVRSRPIQSKRNVGFHLHTSSYCVPICSAGPNRINRSVGPGIHRTQPRRPQSSVFTLRWSEPRECPAHLLLPRHNTTFHFVGRPTTISALSTGTWTFADPLYHRTCVNGARSLTLSVMSSTTKVRSPYESLVSLPTGPTFNFRRFHRSRNPYPPKVDF